MQKQQQKQKSQDYYIGYAQGYKDAVDDLKGWAIQKSDAPTTPIVSPTYPWTIPYYQVTCDPEKLDINKDKWMAALSTSSIC